MKAYPLGTQVPTNPLFSAKTVLYSETIVIFMVLKNNKPLFYSSVGAALVTTSAKALTSIQVGQEI
jgi:hypothetical protein